MGFGLIGVSHVTVLPPPFPQINISPQYLKVLIVSKEVHATATVKGQPALQIIYFKKKFLSFAENVKEIRQSTYTVMNDC